MTWDLEEARSLLTEPVPRLTKILESLEMAVHSATCHDLGSGAVKRMISLDPVGMVQFCSSEDYVEVRVDEKLWWYESGEDDLGTVRLRLTRGDLLRMLEELT